MEYPGLTHQHFERTIALIGMQIFQARTILTKRYANDCAPTVMYNKQYFANIISKNFEAKQVCKIFTDEQPSLLKDTIAVTMIDLIIEHIKNKPTPPLFFKDDWQSSRDATDYLSSFLLQQQHDIHLIKFAVTIKPAQILDSNGTLLLDKLTLLLHDDLPQLIEVIQASIKYLANSAPKCLLQNLQQLLLYLSFHSLDIPPIVTRESCALQQNQILFLAGNNSIIHATTQIESQLASLALKYKKSELYLAKNKPIDIIMNKFVLKKWHIRNLNLFSIRKALTIHHQRMISTARLTHDLKIETRAKLLCNILNKTTLRLLGEKKSDLYEIARWGDINIYKQIDEYLCLSLAEALLPDRGAKALKTLQVWKIYKLWGLITFQTAVKRYYEH